MATLPPVSNQWIPEDDLLLKNAVEAGASLEALAKGAIQFSRRYTLRELRERWHSLLYDPEIAAQASARIFELEVSGLCPGSNSNKPEKENSKKKKRESIRRKYYAMRKKFRSEFLNHSVLGFFESNPHEFVEHVPDFQDQSTRDVNDQLQLQEEDLDILRHAFLGTIQDASGANNEIMGGYGFDERMFPFGECAKNRKGSVAIGEDRISENHAVVYEPNSSHLRHLRTTPSAPNLVLENMIPNDDAQGKENSSSAYTGEFADPDSLLNLSNEEEMLLVDVDEKHVEKKSSVDISDSINQELNKGNQENDTAKVQPETVQLSEATVDSSALNVDMPSKPTLKCDLIELCHGEIRCTLNTEDPEIPCNDDIFLLIHPPTSTGSPPLQLKATVSMNECAPVYEKDNGKGVSSPKKGKDYMSAGLCPQAGGMHGLSDLRSIQTVGCAAKDDIPGFVHKTIGNLGKGKSLYTIPKPCSSSMSKKEVAGASTKVGDSPATMIPPMEAGPVSTSLPESLLNDSVSDQEEPQIDDDVPYFSDVEAMILEMDLYPDDQDARQVPSYQYDDTKRTIIRLEQGASSCLQRAMASQGALAILYGRYLRHYIKKPEVLLGRSTDDFDVDIDLRKEGRANKISRRQAIIKMEADGSFLLKNLGKSSMSVDGLSVATGQLLNLSPSCLIEIKGMSFVFEINQGYVRKNLVELHNIQMMQFSELFWSYIFCNELKYFDLFYQREVTRERAS
ncbi:Forkhead-associated (FHA) domain-containing protein [Striga hermonthica]|uniref:Forkhead-associated (FHA) domain-containing protein n=1 Tax=Striga hermonthica TaxID=68872 RepID=A0A9N7RQ44_STRHE|nr:Forkhead-associated (FHA) domain-containing protein [Striga hermonthica]